VARLEGTGTCRAEGRLLYALAIPHALAMRRQRPIARQNRNLRIRAVANLAGKCTWLDVKLISALHWAVPSQRAIFPLRLSDSLRERAQARASELGLSLNALLTEALDGYWDAPGVAVRSSSAGGVSPARNAPCPCDSGLKFKRCFGR
jgi:hypothetical protein